MGFSQTHSNAPYGSATGQVHYFYASGIEPCPATGGSDDQLMVRVAQPTSGRSLAFNIERLGVMVQIPKPDACGDNEVLIKAHLCVTWPGLEIDNYTFRVEGTYTYAHKRAVVPGRDPLPIGTGPYDSSPTNFRIEQASFDNRPVPGNPEPITRN